MPPIRFATLAICLSIMLACQAISLPFENGVVTLHSIGQQDGYVVEGGLLEANTTSLRVGDENGYPPTPQIVSILSFDTSRLPDDAVLSSVELVLTQESSIIGEGNPFVDFKGLLIDVKQGPFGSSELEPTDYFAPADAGPFGPYMPELAPTYRFVLPPEAYASVNRESGRGGLTQFRLRFALNSNGNARPDYIHFHSGDDPDQRTWPKLIIRYHLPSPLNPAPSP